MGRDVFSCVTKPVQTIEGALQFLLSSVNGIPQRKYENISVIQIKTNHLTVYGMYYFRIDLNIKKKKSKNIYIPRCSGFTLEIYVVMCCLLQ